MNSSAKHGQDPIISGNVMDFIKGRIRLNKNSIENIIQKTALTSRLSSQQISAIINSATNYLVVTANHADLTSDELDHYQRLFDRTQTGDVRSRAKSQRLLERKIRKQPPLDFPPPRPPYDLERFSQWLSSETKMLSLRLEHRRGGRPEHFGLSKMLQMLCATFEVLFGRCCSASREGPTTRFIRSFVEEIRLMIHVMIPTGHDGQKYLDRNWTIDVGVEGWKFRLNQVVNCRLDVDNAKALLADLTGNEIFRVVICPTDSASRVAVFGPNWTPGDCHD